jgi:NAD(P)-dependent dehydrogenase (short-subunit alcohol dehydrogenase family)
MNETSPVYVILGATGGIGSTLAYSLHQQGARMLLAGRSPEKLNALAHTLPKAETQVIEAKDIASVENAIIQASEIFGTVDGVANCIGSFMLKPAHLTSENEWVDTLHINLNSAFGAIRGAAKAMRRNGGSVVLVSSAAARIGLANHEAIAAAKAGIIGLMLSAAATYANKNIRINAVAPGLVQTPLVERITSNEASKNASLGMHALGRLGNAEDIATMIAFLLNPNHHWITGQVFGVDGGLGTLHTRV